MTGEDIKFVGALVDASGRAGGGKVMIGGDWGGGKPASGLVNNQSAKLESYAIATATTVSVDAGTTINASATESGHGGKVVLWSDNQTTFAGTILARGGASGGNGGFVETSSKQTTGLHRQGRHAGAERRSRHAAARSGGFYIIWNGIGPHPAGASSITNTLLQSQLANGNVVIATNNAINPADRSATSSSMQAVSWSHQHHAHAERVPQHQIADLRFDASSRIPAAGNLDLRADSTGTGTGTS